MEPIKIKTIILKECLFGVKKIDITRNFPELSDRIVSIGAVGFDRYTYPKFLDKQKFSKNDLEYEWIVGIAGWALMPFMMSTFESMSSHYEKYVAGQLGLHQQDS